MWINCILSNGPERPHESVGVEYICNKGSQARWHLQFQFALSHDHDVDSSYARKKNALVLRKLEPKINRRVEKHIMRAQASVCWLV